MEEDHVHCVSCVNQRCTVRPRPGISCDLIACPLACGAVFHSCKVDEHHLLCALLRVPCLNRGYGCPAALVRNRMYAHLEVCPAGVVCCTMEWYRWPVSCLDYTSYASLSRGVEEVEQLDMALALQDQRTLLESLKVVAMTPTAEGEALFPAREDNGTTGSGPEASAATESPSRASSPRRPRGSAKGRIVGGINGSSEEHFRQLYEATVETARSLSAALDFASRAQPVGGSDERVERRSGDGGGLRNGPDGSKRKETEERRVCPSCLRGDGADGKILKTTRGPLSGGVAAACLETACLETACPAEVNGDVSAGVPQEAQPAAHAVLEDGGLVLLGNHGPERKFYNYNLFRGPGRCPLPHGRIGLIPDRSVFRLRPRTEDKAVDTSDLDQVDDSIGLGEIDPITAALLFSLEESRECRRVSDAVYVDGRRVDFGTQTFTFPAAVLVTGTRVGEIASAAACYHAAPQLSYRSPFRTLRLGLVLEAPEVEAVPHDRHLPPNPRYRHMFPFVCGQALRRDQFSSHFTNVHGDIHAGLSGWMEHRCPLAYYGCTYSQRRFHPSTEGAKVVHDRRLRAFGVQPRPRATFPGDFQSDQISGLPFEILWHVAGFLDSFSLCQLSLVSRTMREVCASLLQTRGIVELQWERRRWPGTPGAVSWQIKNRVWRFSTAFSPVLSWGFTDLPSMSNHLKKCHFNNVEHKTEPVPLPAMCTARDGHSLRRVLRHVNS